MRVVSGGRGIGEGGAVAIRIPALSHCRLNAVTVGCLGASRPPLVAFCCDRLFACVLCKNGGVMATGGEETVFGLFNRKPTLQADLVSRLSQAGKPPNLLAGGAWHWRYQ
jgi:hypothetical protein